MADQRITQLTALPKAGVAATDVLPIADISASQTKKVTAKDLVDAGLDLIDVSSIDLDKLDQASTTKLGTTALADDAVTAAKLANDSSIAVQTTAPASDNFEGRGYFDSSSGNLQVFDGSAYSQVVMPTAGIGDLQVTTGKLADGAVTTAKVTALGTAAYADSSVTTAKIADDGVTAAKIANGAVTADQLGSGAVTTAKLGSAAVTYDKIQNVSATDRLLGRSTAGAGSVEEITCTSAGRALLDDADAATQRATLGLGTIATGNGTWTDGGSFSGTSSGTNTGDQTITLTGAVTGTGTGSFATAIATSAVTEDAIATNAVSTGKIPDGAITAAKLADSSAAIVAAASPSGTGAFIGQQWFNTNNSQEFTWTGSAWVQQAGIGTINIVDSTPIAIAVAYPDAYSATLTATLDTQAAATVFAGPETGADTVPTFRAIVPGDLPDATASTKGIIQPGTGLAIDAGTLNHANTVTGATVSSITFDNQGHITAAIPLVAADIPELDASKITTGEFPTARLADASITGLKIADSANVQFGETLPVAEHIGQFFFNPLEGSVFLWDGNVWQPVGVTTGAIILAGTYDATTNQVASVTLEGTAIGLTVGSPLPAAADTNANYYVVVSTGGTGTAPAPVATLAPPDLILSTGAAWVEIDVSAGAGAIAAVNVIFSAIGDISATNVQAAIEEVSTECRNATNITSGTLAVARGGTGLASYTKGDILGASAATTLTKLTVGTNGQVLRANSATATGLEWGNDFVGTVTTVTSSTGALTVATATTTPALTIRAATTSVNGIVQLSDSTSTTSSILAATPTAVKAAYDLAALALPKAGGTVTGDITLGTNVGIQFEGTTDDANEIRLIGADATADRTITLPNVTGTVITTGDSGTVTSTMIANGTIVNADINASAAIADTKLATISTAGKVSGTAITSGTIDTSGELQITNTSPSVRLTESDGTATHSQTVIARAGDQFLIQTRSSTGVVLSNDYQIPADASGATEHQWRIAGTEKLSLDSSGLTVVDDLYVSDKIIHAGDTNTAIRFPAADTVTVETDGVERVRITSAGLVGIGTSAPGALLHTVATSAGASIYGGFIQNSDATIGTEVRFAFAPNLNALSSNRHAWIGGVNAGGTNGTALTFATNPGGNVGVERLRITADGNVGIGTTTPTEKLTVSGNVSVSGNVQAASINNGPLAGMRNAIINGNFDIWQRGTSFTGSEYGADRWRHLRNGTTHTATRQAFTLGQTDVPGEPAYFCRTVVSSVAGAGNLSRLDQQIEDVRTFAGQQVTLSFWAKADAIKNIAVTLQQVFGSGGSPSAFVDFGATKISIGTSWQKVTVTATAPSISGKTLGTDNNDSLAAIIWFDAGSDYNSLTDSLGQQSGTFDIAQVQVEPGPVATPFERRPFGTELALCQRYYAIVNTYMAGYTAGAFSNSYSLQLATEMREIPTITVGATINTNTTGASVVNNGVGHVRHASVGVGVGGFISSAAATLSAEL